jgi:pimeloyl-ACP methyl ester carboxylesterase
MIWLLLTGCLDLDTMVHNGVPCSIVGPATCEDKDNDWDRICASCEEEYDWAQDFAWMDGTLAEGEEVRPIPAEAVERLTLPTDDGLGELDLYRFEGHGEEPATAGLTLLYNHGNYGGLEHYNARIRLLWELGWTIVAWDYRGYGKSLPASPPVAAQFLSDAHQVLDWTLSDGGASPESLVLYANSLGAIPAVEMALSTTPCALLLEAPFPGLKQAQQDNTGLSLPGTFFSQGDYENTEKIKGNTAPTLIMGGDADTFFTVADYQGLYDNTAGPRELWILPGVRHGISDGGVPEAGMTDYHQHMLDFLANTAGACAG